MRVLMRMAGIVLPVLLAACASTGPTLTKNVGAIRTSAAAVDDETQRHFAEINAAAREDAINRLILSRQPPSEKGLGSIIGPDTAGKWSAAFDSMDEYLASLQDLVDGKRPEQMAADLGEIATALEDGEAQARFPKGVGGLLSGLFQSLAQAAAENRAREAMLNADRPFNAVIRRMADLIDTPVSEPDLKSLHFKVDAHWTSVLSGLRNDYDHVAEGSADDRRRVLIAYGEALDSRAAQFAELANLKQSLLAIGEAHSSAAHDKSGATLFWIARLNQLLTEARAEAKEQEK